MHLRGGDPVVPFLLRRLLQAGPEMLPLLGAEGKLANLLRAPHPPSQDLAGQFGAQIRVPLRGGG